MSVKRYLEVDSTYRDRKEFTHPSQFQVSINGNNITNKLEAKDSVCNSAPILVWNNNFREDTNGFLTNFFSTGSFLTVSPVNSPTTNGNQTFLVNSTIRLRQVRDFYVGCNLSKYSVISSINRRITQYLPLNLNNAIVTLEQALPDCEIGTNNFYIQNQSSIKLSDFIIFDQTASPLIFGGNRYLINFTYPTSLNSTPNYYAGWTFGIGSNQTFPPTEPILETTVIGSGFSGPNFYIDVLSSIGGSLNQSGYYLKPPNFNVNNLRNVLTFWIPISNDSYEQTQRTSYYGSGDDNFYVDLIVQSLSDLSSSKIYSFNSSTRLATLSYPPTRPDGSWSYNWERNTNNYVMRREQAISFNISGLLKKAWGTSVSLNLVPIGPLETNLRKKLENDYFYTDKYNGDFLRIYSIFTPPYILPVNEQIQIKKFIYAKGNVLSITPLSVVLGDGSDIDGEYNDCILQTLYISDDIFNFSGFAKIKNYDATTKVAILYEPIDLWPPGFNIIMKKWGISTCIMVTPFTINTNNLYFGFWEIEPFSYDNARPFNYTGSLLSNTESVCYEIELVNLIIPNTTLVSGRGGRAIFYPYFYVELKPLTSAMTMSNGIICSNNPNAYKMLFRAIVNDISAPEDTPFLKIDGDGMVQTVKFNIHDSFLFSVYHSNGELLQTDILEQYSPTEPNSRCQISACFSFKRI
jgi:hypothetical protein